MSSRRTRKNRNRSRRSNRRTRQRGGARSERSLNPKSLIYLPETTRKFLTPIERAKELADKAAKLINADPELLKPTSAQKRKERILQRVEERKRQKKQRKLIPKPPPSQTRRNVQEISARKKSIKKRLEKNRKIQNLKVDMIRNEANEELKRQEKLMPKRPSQPRKTQKRPGRTILKKKPKKTSPSKSKSNTQSRRTILPKPPSKSQKKGQGKRPAPKLTRVPSNFTFKDIEDKGKGRRSKFVKNFGPKEVNKRLNSSERSIRTRNPPKRLTYTN